MGDEQEIITCMPIICGASNRAFGAIVDITGSEMDISTELIVEWNRLTKREKKIFIAFWQQSKPLKAGALPVCLLRLLLQQVD